MPIRAMEYGGRPLDERGPHQIAAALASVVEELAKALGRHGFDVADHGPLRRAILNAGAEILSGVQAADERGHPRQFNRPPDFPEQPTRAAAAEPARRSPPTTPP